MKGRDPAALSSQIFDLKPNESCREAPARALIGFYERRVVKERSFRKINTHWSEWTRKKV